MKIEDWIDLHGFAPRDVLSAVEEYLDVAAREGFEEVRLVHGRGKGVQRRRVQELLATHPLVLSYRDAPPTRGGLGATLVWLRRVDASGRTRWLWRMPRDRELARRQWHALLHEALARADRVSWSARERGPWRVALSTAFPFVRFVRAPDASVIFANMDCELGAREEDGWPLTSPVRDYLLAREHIDDWEQRRGFPEDPTLREGALVVLAASQGEVTVYLDEPERERLGDIDLVPA